MEGECMAMITDDNLKNISNWRAELLKEIHKLEVELEEKRQGLQFLQLQSDILDRASNRFNPKDKESFWKTYCEELEKERSVKFIEFEEVRKQNYKKMRELQAIIKSIEEFLIINNYSS